jgi:hypothetical protein
MSSVVVVTSDPAITVAQDNPAVTTILPVTGQPPTQIGFGQSIPLAPSTDFNTVVTPGFYNTSDINSLNAPVASQNWYLWVSVDGAATNNIVQTVTEFSNSTVTTCPRC